jgi:hypothetical protein
MTPEQFAISKLVYCFLLGASETSGYRTLRHNAKLGGVAHSPHLLGLAADLVYDEPVELSVRQEWARRCGFKLVVEGDHDHIQPAEWEAG